MKMALSIPDGQGGSKVFCDFERALDLIKQADQLTLHVPKILYLVGWQYMGHDDKYPAMFEVNQSLKRPGDRDAKSSLQWLMREARKYHTTVSLHINMTDAYDDSPLWPIYVDQDLISKDQFGELLVIGNYNNRKAYQINYKREWEAGWTQRRIDSLLTLLPELTEAGTIHIDAWIARDSKGHQETSVTEAAYQKKALTYWAERGMDVTSEWAMDYMTGLVPFAWHFNHRTQEQYLQIPASVYTGSGINPDLKWSDFGLGFLFGQSMYGESIWPNTRKNPSENEQWEKTFVREFYTKSLQYFFLNQKERLGVEGNGNSRVSRFSDEVSVSLADSVVRQGEILLREKNVLMFPVTWNNGESIALFSEKEEPSRTFWLPPVWSGLTEVALYEISVTGLRKLGKPKVNEGAVNFALKPGQPYLLRVE